MSLLIDRYFQFDHEVYCEYLCTPVFLDHTAFHPKRGLVHIEGQQNMCHRQLLVGVV